MWYPPWGWWFEIRGEKISSWGEGTTITGRENVVRGCWYDSVDWANLERDKCVSRTYSGWKIENETSSSPRTYPAYAGELLLHGSWIRDGWCWQDVLNTKYLGKNGVRLLLILSFFWKLTMRISRVSTSSHIPLRKGNSWTLSLSRCSTN